MNLEGAALDMFRDVVNYALVDQRNGGLEQAARIVEGCHRCHPLDLARQIRALKTDPKASWAKTRDEIAAACSPWFEIEQEGKP